MTIQEKKKISPFVFFQQVRQEVARITWPTRKEVVITSILVFVMVFIFVLFFLTVDNVIALAVRFVLGWGK